MYRDREAFEPGINNYVPGMQYASAMVSHAPKEFSLGTPAVAAANNVFNDIDADAVANTLTAINVTLDATYGRTLRMTPSADPGNAFIIDIYGWDYLGQPMIERFTGANGATAILYGKKAFKKVHQSKIITPATNAIVADLGTGTRLGLPYKGDVVWAKENGIFVPVFGRNQIMTVDRSDADATAGGSVWLRPPFPGFIASLFGVPFGGGSTNDPVATVELGGVAVTGLAVTIDTSNAAGLTVTDAPTTPGYSANNRFVANDLIEIVVAAAASAGPDQVGVVLTPTHFTLPDVTDPATNITGDPRGTYDPITPPDGTEIIVGLRGDNVVNTSNHGGLHGIQHYGG